MLEFEVIGRGHERGLAHGQRFSSLIREHVAQYQLGPEWEGEKARVVTAIETNLPEQAPDLYAEIEGIADGAGLPIRDILALNYWIEVLQATVGVGCSLIGFEETAEGAILGKNSDHDLAAVRYLAMQRVRPAAGSEGHTFVRGTFVGTTSTRAGLNSAGLALCGAALIPTETNWEGIPIMAVIDQILRHCASVDEAIRMAEGLAPINYGANLMVADRRGALALIERLPHQMAVRWPADGVLFNTNHPLAAETAGHVREGTELMESSRARFRKLEGLVTAVPRSSSGLRQVLTDHTEPGAICQHGAGGWYTCASFLISPAAGTVVVADGSPCATEYKESGLELP